MHRQKYRIIIPYLLPSAILYAIFVLYPYAQAMYGSLTVWNGYTANMKYVGLYNFQQMVADPLFWNALRHNAVFLVVLPVFTLSLAIFFAFMFTQVRGSGFVAKLTHVYRVAFFFPQVMSAVAIAVLWGFIFHPTIGIINSALRLIGVTGPAWIGDPATSLASVVIVAVWSGVGFYMVLFIAGMQSIPITYYEAARLDGAAGSRLFLSITWPLLWDHVRTALIFICIGAMDMFTLVQVLTAGGPNHSSDVLATYLYQSAFTNGAFGYATALGVALFIITMLISGLLFLVGRSERLEY